MGNEPWRLPILVAHKNVPALKIAEHKIFVFSVGEGSCSALQNPLMSFCCHRVCAGRRNIFEIQQVSHDGFLAEFLCWSDIFIVQSLAFSPAE